MKQCILTLGMVGVQTPGIWIAVVEKPMIAELRRTPRDDSGHERLMRHRIEMPDLHEAFRSPECHRRDN